MRRSNVKRPAQIERIVIVGGGTAGWMAAAALSKVLGPRGPSISLVESDEIGTVGVGEATIPQINVFNRLLEIDEDEFVRATQATYKLGIEFVDWTRLGDRYIHPFGWYGLDMGGIDFHHHWLKGRALGETASLGEYSIGVAAAMRERFMRPDPAKGNSPLARIAYAFQFDAALYAQFLRRLAEDRGVQRTEGRVAEVRQNSENGHITAVRLADGREIAGDLWIDCSGFAGLLINQTLGVAFEDWTEWLPCDRAVAVPCVRNGDPLPYTRATARAAGWQWRIPLQHRTGNGYVYASNHLSDDEATATLLSNLDGEALAEPRMLRFRAGHRRRAWDRNVVALGLAGGFLEPLESTSIHLVQSGIARLLTFFPTAAFDEAEIAQYNAASVQEYVTIRDFLILHYLATERNDSPFWDRCRTLTPPPGLTRKLSLFRSNGRIVRESEELFTETSWLAVMDGQGIKPAGYHPVADLFSDTETLARLRNIRAVTATAADSMPRHADFVAAGRQARAVL